MDTTAAPNPLITIPIDGVPPVVRSTDCFRRDGEECVFRDLGWENFRDVAKVAYEAEGVTLRANSVAELASKIGVSGAALQQTITRFNDLTKDGVDTDFQAFGPQTSPKPKPIDTPPFYAARFFPITRKSMGGVRDDLQCRVLTPEHKPIPNLFAVGAVTRFGGINGKAALEGTFLGPAALMGRVAGRTVAPETKAVAFRKFAARSGRGAEEGVRQWSMLIVPCRGRAGFAEAERVLALRAVAPKGVGPRLFLRTVP